jgi:hypothetical protein
MTDGEQLDRLDQQYPFTATEMALLDAAVLAIASPPETSAANFSKSWETFAPVPGEVTPRQVLRLVQLTKDIHSQLIRLGRFTAVKDLSAAVAQAVPKAARSLPQNPRLLARLCHLQFELYLAGADAALRCDDSSARESLLRAAKNQAVGLQIVAQDDALMKRLPSGS